MCRRRRRRRTHRPAVTASRSQLLATTLSFACIDLYDIHHLHHTTHRATIIVSAQPTITRNTVSHIGCSSDAYNLSGYLSIHLRDDPTNSIPCCHTPTSTTTTTTTTML